MKVSELKKVAGCEISYLSHRGDQSVPGLIKYSHIHNYLPCSIRGQYILSCCMTGFCDLKYVCEIGAKISNNLKITNMRASELIKISTNLLKLLSKYDIKTEDVKYVELYTDYEKMVFKGEKITYIVSFLSDKYKVSEATIYRIIRRFRKTVTV